jgi:hypothetical protein
MWAMAVHHNQRCREGIEGGCAGLPDVLIRKLVKARIAEAAG